MTAGRYSMRGIGSKLCFGVDAVFLGKERKFNRRFLQMCNHYLVEPTACTPAAGWETRRATPQA